MVRIFTFICFLTLGSLCTYSQDKREPVIPVANPALRFTENLGQWDNHILFRAQLDGGALFLEPNQLTFNFYNRKQFRQLFHPLKKEHPSISEVECHAYRIKFENANPSPIVVKENKGTDYENFFLGNDPSKWKGNVQNYHRVWYKNIYNGIDYEMITAVNGLKYNFHIKAGTSPSAIKLNYEGIQQLRLKNGKLNYSLILGEINEQKPYAYQLINGVLKEVACQYKINGTTVSYDFPNSYDANYDLVIDPTLVFSAQIGTTADNFGMTATYDNAGNLYSGGIVFNFGYPTTIGAYATSFNGPSCGGNTDVFLTKYNATGNQLVFSTYLGGAYAESVHSLVVDNSNNLCFYGATSSTNFPTTNGCFDNTFNGGSSIVFVGNGLNFINGTDIYLGKLNSSGSQLLASTFFGGSGNDGINYGNNTSPSSATLCAPTNTSFPTVNSSDAANTIFRNYGDQSRGEIQVDLANNIYIVSSTQSSNLNFPALSFDNSLNGTQDGVFAKFNTNLTTLLNYGYIGGSGNDAANGLLIKPNGSVYVTGGTSSNDILPSYLPPAFDMSFNGIIDSYILTISPTGTVYLHGTYFGTPSYDQSFFIQDDPNGDIYIYGQTQGTIAPVIAPTQTVIYNNPNKHQFITRFNASLTTQQMATCFGSSNLGPDISPSAFAVDKCFNIYLSGWGGNAIGGAPIPGMPILNPLLGFSNSTGNSDFYLMALSKDATTLQLGTYFGGPSGGDHVDGGTSRFDKRGIIYQSVCASCGGLQDFPIQPPGTWPCTGGPCAPNTATILPDNSGGRCNNGVFKINFDLQLAISTINTNTLNGCVPLTVSFTNATAPTGSLATFIWYLGNGQTTTTNINPTVTFTAAGVYTVALVVNDPSTCNIKDSSVTFITVLPSPTSAFTASVTQCTNTLTLANNSSGTLTANPYVWNFGDGSPTSTLTAPQHTYTTNGTYTVSLLTSAVNGCTASTTQTVQVFTFTPSVNSPTICEGLGTSFLASGGTSYSWSPPANLSATNIANPAVTPTSTSIYTVTVANNSPGFTCIKTSTALVTMRPKSVANFSLSSTPCSNLVTFTNTSTTAAPSLSVTYNFGDGSPTSTVSNPSHTYTSTGTYTVTLNAINNFSCTDVTTQTVNILIFNPGVAAGGSACRGVPVQLSANGGTSYSWSPANGISNTAISNPVVNTSTIVGAQGSAIYSVTINNNTFGFNCSRTLTTQVTVLPKPTSNFNFSINPCGGGVTFTDASQVNISNWLWTYNNTTTVTTQNFYNFFFQGYSGTVSLVVTNTDGCKDTIIKPLNVPVPPPVSILSNTTICKGNTAHLNATGGISYQWTPTVSLDVPNIATPFATPSVSTVYTVIITATNSIGQPCSLLLTTTVNVSQLSTVPVSANANPVVVTTGSATTLTYLGDPGALVTWLPPGSTTPGTGYTVTAYPDRPTTYTAVATNGPCSERTTVYVEAYSGGCIDEDVFVPNTFTPNGDGKNDVLFVRGLKVNEIYFAVYNRWGEMVFETKDKSLGWDGIYNGRPADVGVFGWYLRVKCINGEEAFKKGNVTLIR